MYLICVIEHFDTSFSTLIENINKMTFKKIYYFYLFRNFHFNSSFQIIIFSFKHYSIYNKKKIIRLILIQSDFYNKKIITVNKYIIVDLCI